MSVCDDEDEVEEGGSRWTVKVVHFLTVTDTLRAADPANYAGKQIHEIQPVKFGGSPTDPANKIALTPQEHYPLTTWWKRFQRGLEE